MATTETKGATGTVALTRRATPEWPGEILINDEPYQYTPVRVAGVLVGVRVGRYEVCLAAGSQRCTCDDFVRRRGPAGEQCKHLRASAVLAGARSL